MISIQLWGQTFQLLPEKAIFWTEKQYLLLTDPHLGKVSHFRKAGIPIPEDCYKQDLATLQLLLENHQPNRCIFLGDLFHSTYNKEWKDLTDVLTRYPMIDFILVKGNHDIWGQGYLPTALTVVEELLIAPFRLVHHPEPLEEVDTSKVNDYYTLAGHIHPAVVLQGKGAQALKLPCFYFGKTQGILPAFGAFTGLARLKPVKGDQVYVIAEGEVIQVL